MESLENDTNANINFLIRKARRHYITFTKNVDDLETTTSSTISTLRQILEDLEKSLNVNE